MDLGQLAFTFGALTPGKGYSRNTALWNFRQAPWIEGRKRIIVRFAGRDAPRHSESGTFGENILESIYKLSHKTAYDRLISYQDGDIFQRV
jgi:hypothetical protein